jgi:hypothetical protein
MDNDDKSPRGFQLDTPDQVEEFIDYLKSAYSTDYNRPDIGPDSEWFTEILRYAESGAFRRAMILPDGEIIWTKKT